MVVSMRTLFVLSLEMRQGIKNLGGVERNLRESPDLTVSRTQVSVVISSQQSAKWARRPPTQADWTCSHFKHLKG